MTSIYLITGFLGAGKTTFLNDRLANVTSRVGVLMNEFGKISMDSITIEKDDMTLMELSNGSIFCSCLKENFIKALAELVNLQLDEIYIESSGLSDPSDMGKVMEVLKTLTNPGKFEFKGTICLVDGMFFKQELGKMVSVERQIKHSHHILVNKVDLINTEKLSEIIDLIKGINPKAAITPVSFGKVNWSELMLDDFHIMDEESTNKIESKPKNIVINFIKEPTLEQLNGFLNQMPQYFYRIKGFILIEKVWYKVDLVNEQISIMPFEVNKLNDKETGLNQLVCLSSKGIKSISHLVQVAEKNLAKMFTLEI